MKVKVYRNLHKKMYSVVDMKTGKVFRHQHHVVLKNARFRVSEAGRARVLKEKRKNVHAFVIGTLLEKDFHFPDREPTMGTYNPYKHKTFVKKGTRRALRDAELVLLAPKEMYVWEEQ